MIQSPHSHLYSSELLKLLHKIISSTMKKLQELLEDVYKDFESIENTAKSSHVLGSELWESKFD